MSRALTPEEADEAEATNTLTKSAVEVSCDEWVDAAERLCDAYRILERHRNEENFGNEEWCEAQWRKLWLLVQKAKASA